MKLSRKKRALFALVVFVVVAALGEVVSRALYSRVVPPQYEDSYERLLTRTLSAGYFPAFRPHPYTCFELNPDYEPRGVRWHTKDGFRPPDMPKARRAGVYRIACLGGSTTYENDREMPYTWVAYLEEYLNRRFPSHPIEVLNAGVGGANSADNFGRFHFKVLDYSPDLVVNYDGINDVWPMLCPGPFENDLRHARKPMEAFTPPGEITSFLARHSWSFRALYFRLVLKSRIPSIMDLTYKDMELSEAVYEKASTSCFRRNLEDEAFICRGRGIGFVLATCALDDFQTGRDVKENPYAIVLRGTDDLNLVVKDVAAKLSLPLLDFDREMPRNDMKSPEASHYFGDVCHNTIRGDRVKANIFGRFLVPLLEKNLGVQASSFELDTTVEASAQAARLER